MSEDIEEVWVRIPGYSDYIVSNQGHIYNTKHRRYLKGYVSRTGAINIELRGGSGETNPSTLHGIVASAFMPDYKRGVRIVHIDGDKQNNRVENLKLGEQPTRRLGVLGHSYKVGKRVVIENTGEIFKTPTALADALGAHPSSIYKVLRGERKSYMGYNIRYLDEQ